MVILSTNVNVVIFLYFINGLTTAGRSVVGVMFMSEFAPKRNKVLLMSLFNMAIAILMALHATYYLFKKDWLPLHVFALSFGTINLCLVLQLPESPNFLYTHKRFDEARAVLNTIAKFNGSAYDVAQI